MVVAGVLILGLLLRAASVDRDDPGDIVRQLMPHGDHFEVNLNGISRATAIRKLLAAQRNAKAQRSRDIAFLLAALGSGYKKNRDFLLGIISQCGSIDMPCNEDTVLLVIRLFENGHGDVLQVLIRAGAHADGAVAEALGPFYASVLKRETRSFLQGVAALPSSDQDSVCELAVGGDGSGIDPTESWRIQQALKAIGGTTAAQCLHHFRNPPE